MASGAEAVCIVAWSLSHATGPVPSVSGSDFFFLLITPLPTGLWFGEAADANALTDSGCAVEVR